MMKLERPIAHVTDATKWKRRRTESGTQQLSQ